MLSDWYNCLLLRAMALTAACEAQWLDMSQSNSSGKHSRDRECDCVDAGIYGLNMSRGGIPLTEKMRGNNDCHVLLGQVPAQSQLTKDKA
jgi:hypothetical protein